MKKILLLSIIVLTLLPVTLGETETTDTSIYVVHKTPYPGATIQIISRETGQQITALTDTAGRAYFQTVEPGKYEIYITTPFESPKTFTTYISRESNVFVYDTIKEHFTASLSTARTVVVITGLQPLERVSLGSYGTTADMKGKAIFIDIPRGSYSLQSATTMGIIKTGLLCQTLSIASGHITEKSSIASIIFLMAATIMFGLSTVIPRRFILAKTINWFGMSRDWAEWREFTQFDVYLIGSMIMATMITFIWMYINTELKSMSIAYLFLGVTDGLVIALVVGSDRRTRNHIAAITTSTEDSTTDDKTKSIVLGVGIGLAMLAISNTILGIMTTAQVVPINMYVISNIMIIGILVPITEEITFQGTLFPTLAMLTGAIPGTILTALTFGFFHWQVYGGSIPLLSSAVIFRLIISSVFIYRRSVYVGIAAHILYNTMSIIGSLH